MSNPIERLEADIDGIVERGVAKVKEAWSALPFRAVPSHEDVLEAIKVGIKHVVAEIVAAAKDPEDAPIADPGLGDDPQDPPDASPQEDASSAEGADAIATPSNDAT